MAKNRDGDWVGIMWATQSHYNRWCHGHRRGIPVQTSVPALPDPKATLAVMAFLVSMVKMEDQGPKDPLDHQAKQDHRDSLAW